MPGFSSILLVFLCGLLAVSGCAGLTTRRAARETGLSNPIVISAAHEDVAWERTVDVLHEFHFEIERENRQARTIETKYRVGSSAFEPWHKESVGWHNRIESTLQSIRRKVIITMVPSPEQASGYAVQVVALKELEELNAIAANSPGGATFQEGAPLERDLTQVLGQSRPSGWIPQGRDLELERALIASLIKHTIKANRNR